MRRKGKTTGLGDALSSVLRDLDRTGRAASVSAKVAMAWERLAGGLVLAHTTGVHLRGKELIVYVDGSSWATHFTAMREQYRAAVNEDLGQDLVSEVRFIVSRKVAEQHQLKTRSQEVEAFYAGDRTVPVPLTGEEIAAVEKSVTGIPDESLREAVLRATIKDMEWKKGLAEQGKAAAQ